MLSVNQDKHLWFIELIACWYGYITGLRWYLRAFCEKLQQYRDFVLSQFRYVPDLRNKTSINAIQDCGWHLVLSLIFTTAPLLSPQQHGQLMLNIRNLIISLDAQQQVFINVDAVNLWFVEEKS